MAKKVLTNLDLVLNQLLNARLQQVPGDPSTLIESLFWYNSVTKRPMFYDGTEAKNFGIEYQTGTGIDISNEVISVDFDDVASAAQGALADTAIQPNDNISELYNDVGYITSSSLPTKISDLTDDTATYPIDKADTLTGLTATITELNYVDGVTSSIQSQLNGKQSTIDSSNKLLSDLVDDTNQTHKFATSSQLTQISTNQTDISTINGKIPSQASSSNQLADKNFVNSSVSTNTAYFDGTWDTYALVPTTVAGFTSLGLPEPTNNNYLVVKEDETQDGGTWRYKYVDDGTAYNKNKWHVEYEVNETPLTAAQIAALNSGITDTLVTQIGTNQTNISNLQTAVAGKQDSLTFSTGLTNTSGTITVTDYNKLIKNTATGLNSLSILGTAEDESNIAIGNGATVFNNTTGAIAIGDSTVSSGSNYSIAIGRLALVDTNKEYAIQIGEGVNSTANTLAIGFGEDIDDNALEYTLLDGTTGLIPDARISSNIARISDLSNITQRYNTTNPALTASGGLCTWTVTHNIGRQFVQVKVYETSTGEEVIVDVVCTSTTVTTVKINSSTNIAAGTYTVVVQG